MFALFVTFIVFIIVLFGGIVLADKLEINDGWKLAFALAVVAAGCVFLSLDPSDITEVQQWLDQQKQYRLKSVDEILDSLPEKEEKWGIK